jgi:hypothetical protein
MLRIFDEHNDSVQRLQEYRADCVDFLARSTSRRSMPFEKDPMRD